MSSFKYTLTLISLFWKNLKGIFLQERFTNEYFGMEISFWRTKFQRDHHKSLHRKLKWYISHTSLDLQSIILEALIFLFYLVSLWEEHFFFLLTNRFLYIWLLAYETFGIHWNETIYCIWPQTLSLFVSIKKRKYHVRCSSNNLRALVHVLL